MGKKKITTSPPSPLLAPSFTGPALAFPLMKLSRAHLAPRALSLFCRAFPSCFTTTPGVVVVQRLKNLKQKHWEAKGRSLMVPASLHYSNVNLIDPTSGLPTRVGNGYLDDGTKVTGRRNARVGARRAGFSGLAASLDRTERYLPCPRSAGVSCACSRFSDLAARACSPFPVSPGAHREEVGGHHSQARIHAPAAEKHRGGANGHEPRRRARRYLRPWDKLQAAA